MPRYSLIQGSLCIEPETSGTYEIRVMGVKKPVVLSEVSYTSATTKIAFVHSSSAADTITDADSKFVTEGFKAGDMIRVNDSVSNDGEYLVVTVVAGTLTLHAREVLTTEAASAIDITITTVTPFEEEYQDVIASLAALKITEKFGLGGEERIARISNRDLSDLIADTEFQEENFRAMYKDF